MKPKTKSLAELRDLASAGAEVTDKDGIGVRFAEKAKPAPVTAPVTALVTASDRELSAALDRFSLSLNVLLSSSQTMSANVAEAVAQLRREVEQSARKSKPSSWVFDVKRDGNGNMTITANPVA